MFVSFISSPAISLTRLFHSADVTDPASAALRLSCYFTSALYSRAPCQGVSSAPGRAMGSVSTGGAAALSARWFDGRQSAKRRGGHTAAACTGIRQPQAPGASHAVRLSARIGHFMKVHSKGMFWARS